MRLGLVIYGTLETLSGGYLYDRKLVEYLRGQGDEVEIISQPWRSYAAHLRQNVSREMEDNLAQLPLDFLLQDELNHPSLFLLNQRLRRRVSYPILSIVHHLRSSESHPAAALALYRQVERRYLRSVDGFVFNSQTTRSAVESLLNGPAKGIVATPGGDQDAGEESAGLSENVIRLRAEKPGPLRVLFVGNLIKRKGLHTLIAALARLPKSSWVLHVVGRREVDPRYTARIRAQVKAAGLVEQVFLLGQLSDELLRDEWKRCHVLAVPSQYEGFGIVYLEGMAYGVPAIASTSGAAGEIIRDGDNGFLVPPENPMVLSERLAMLSGDRTRLVQMSLAARRRFADFPTWEQSAAGIRQYLLSWGSSP